MIDLIKYGACGWSSRQSIDSCIANVDALFIQCLSSFRSLVPFAAPPFGHCHIAGSFTLQFRCIYLVYTTLSLHGNTEVKIVTYKVFRKYKSRFSCIRFKADFRIRSPVSFPMLVTRSGLCRTSKNSPEWENLWHMLDSLVWLARKEGSSGVVVNGEF